MGYGEMFSPGKLRYRITIERPETTRNSLGESVVEWHEFATVWAAIQNLTGREIISNAREEFSLTHRVVIRHLPNLLPKFRIMWDGRRLEISSILSSRPHGTVQWLELLCSESKE